MPDEYLDRDDYKAAATKAAEFVLENLRDDDGRLKRSYAAGEAKLNAYIDDYAFFASGSLRTCTVRPATTNGSSSAGK